AKADLVVATTLRNPRAAVTHSCRSSMRREGLPGQCVVVDEVRREQTEVVRAGIRAEVDLVAGFVQHEEPTPGGHGAGPPGLATAAVKAAAWLFRWRDRRSWPSTVFLALNSERGYACELRFGPTTFRRLVAQWDLDDPTIRCTRTGPLSFDLHHEGHLVPLRAMSSDPAAVEVIELLTKQVHGDRPPPLP
ncbi:MAG: hypothetical protein ABL966_14230, partial [Acidimicrobiales bacterium]